MLSGEELVGKTYELIKGEEISLDYCIEIANDSDYHRTRIGYMQYDEGKEFGIDGKKWLLVKGYASGSYPAEPYGHDLTCLDITLKEHADEEFLSRSFRKADYFRNSLFFTLRGGELCFVEKSVFGQRIHALLFSIKDYVAQEPEYDKSVISLSTLSHPNKKSMKYHDWFPERLAEGIHGILKETDYVYVDKKDHEMFKKILELSEGKDVINEKEIDDYAFFKTIDYEQDGLITREKNGTYETLITLTPFGKRYMENKIK